MKWFKYVLRVCDYNDGRPMAVLTADTLPGLMLLFVGKYGSDIQGKYILDIQQPEYK